MVRHKNLSNFTVSYGMFSLCSGWYLPKMVQEQTTSQQQAGGFKVITNWRMCIFLHFFQIISLDQTKVIENVPDALVMYIPVVLLSSLSSVNVSLVNNKRWSHEQVTEHAHTNT